MKEAHNIDQLLIALGFSMIFSSDPQEQNASKLYQKGDILIHQPDEEKLFFIVEQNER